MTTPQLLQIKTLTDGSAHYTFRTNLDGIDYQFGLDWSEREARWYLSIRTAEGDLLCSNVKILANWPMLRYFHYRTGMPEGELMAVTLTHDTTPPDLYELGVGKRCTLTYFPVGSVTL